MAPKATVNKAENAAVATQAKHKSKAAAKADAATAKASKAKPKAKKEAPVTAKAAEAEKSKVKKRVKRDKEAPKKPMSPFFCYQAVRRPLLKLEQPTLNNTEFIKVMS